MKLEYQETKASLKRFKKQKREKRKLIREERRKERERMELRKAMGGHHDYC